MESGEFLRTIKACRRRLNQAERTKKLLFALSVGASVGIIFQAVSLVVPFYYANLYTGLALLLAILTALLLAALKRCTMEEAALVMDGFGFEERIVTAYEHLGEEGGLIALQRKDALQMLQANRGKIRIPVWPSWKYVLLTSGTLVVLLVLALVPSTVKDRARELHQISREAREKEKEVEEIVKELQNLEEQEQVQQELTQEQLAVLQELIESLQSSEAEYQQADSHEALETAGEKLNYKYENMSTRLSELAESLQNGAAVSAVTADSMQAMAEKLQELSGNTAAQGSIASNQGQGSNPTEDAENGGEGDGQDGDSTGNGEGGNQGDGQNGNSTGNGEGGNQGDGSGSGNVSSDGNGDGSGSGSNQGDGNGLGNGRGTGSSDAVHDYVSVPNAIADSGNLTGNAADHDTSQYFQAPNGLTWEGTRISHEAVIGSYEQNAYEGIAAGKYPSGMEDVIKNYFSSFN